MPDLLLWLLFVLFALLAALSTAALATLTQVARLLRNAAQEEGTRGNTPARALEDRAAMLSLGVVVSTVSVAGAAGSGVLIAAAQWVEAPWRGAVIGLVLLGTLLLLQAAARVLALHGPDRAAARLISLWRVLRVMLWPLIAASAALERRLGSVLGSKPTPETADMQQELERLVQAAEQNGGLEEEEREMIQSIFRLGQRPVREIMVPRIDVAALDRTATARQVLERIAATGHSRIPIYDGSVDNVVGVLHAKDLLKHLRDRTLDEAVGELARSPYFVPETKKIDELLHEMQQRKTHMAIVVDEYGGTAGLITIEDMLEEIVGEIEDEYDVDEPRFERVSESEAIFDARMNIHDVGEVLDADLTEELEEHEFDTLGGLVYERLGKVPVAGDEVRVNGYLISVLSTEGHRIKKVKVTLGIEPEAARGPAHQ